MRVEVLPVPPVRRIVMVRRVSKVLAGARVLSDSLYRIVTRTINTHAVCCGQYGVKP